MNQSLQDNFKKTTTQANLSREDEQGLERLMMAVPGIKEKEELMELLVKNPKLVSKLVENFKKKKEIIKNQDNTAWQKLLAEETKLVEQVAKAE